MGEPVQPLQHVLWEGNYLWGRYVSAVCGEGHMLACDEYGREEEELLQAGGGLMPNHLELCITFFLCLGGRRLNLHGAA